MSPWGEEGVEEEGVKREGSDLFAIILKLGSGNFKFEYVDIVDRNNVKRIMFGAGEEVYYNLGFVNKGDSRDDCKFTIYNAGLDKVIKTETYPNMDPLASGTIDKAKLGVMPDSDWNVHFILEP